MKFHASTFNAPMVLLVPALAAAPAAYATSDAASMQDIRKETRDLLNGARVLYGRAA